MYSSCQNNCTPIICYSGVCYCHSQVDNRLILARLNEVDHKIDELVKDVKKLTDKKAVREEDEFQVCQSPAGRLAKGDA